MIEDGCRVDEYLDKPEELKKLINAQLLTNNLDTRPNPNKDIKSIGAMLFKRIGRRTYAVRMEKSDLFTGIGKERGILILYKRWVDRISPV